MGAESSIRIEFDDCPLLGKVLILQDNTLDTYVYDRVGMVLGSCIQRRTGTRITTRNYSCAER